MITTPQILPISDMRNHHPAVLDKLENGPVFLTRRGKGTAVLLSMPQWERLMDYIEEQTDIIDILEAKLAETQGEVAEPFDMDELRAMADGKRVPA